MTLLKGTLGNFPIHRAKYITLYLLLHTTVYLLFHLNQRTGWENHGKYLLLGKNKVKKTLSFFSSNELCVVQSDNAHFGDTFHLKEMQQTHVKEYKSICRFDSFRGWLEPSEGLKMNAINFLMQSWVTFFADTTYAQIIALNGSKQQQKMNFI